MYVSVPENITQIRSLAFYHSTLRSIFFGDSSLQAIGDSAFNKSSLSGTIFIPDGVNTIGDYCFLSCKQITKVYIPSSVVLLGKGVFRYCDKLVEISVDEDNANYCSIDGFLYNKSKTVLISAPSAFIGTHTVPDSITRIEEFAFACFTGECTVDISKCNSLEIGQNAFTDAKNLVLKIREGKKDYFTKRGISQNLLSEVVDFSNVVVGGSSLHDAIANNPFRMLGVYVNASSKEQNASLTKLKRYLDVNKSPEMECDLHELFGPLSRTNEIITEANSSIYLPADRFKAALFWLAKTEPFHDIAFGHLKAGNYSKVFEILSKCNSWGCVLNRSTLALSIGKVSYGIENLFKLVCDDSLRSDFCKCVCGDDYSIDAKDASDIIIDILLAKMDPKELWQQLSSCITKHPSSLDYLSTKILEPYISAIEIAVSRARESFSATPKENYKAGIQLMNLTKASLAKLLELRAVSEQRVNNCIDNLAKTILQCGINYYNGSDDEYDAAKNAMVLQEYAETISIGQLVKDRCKKNTDILRDIIKSLPDREIYEYTKKLNVIFQKYSISERTNTPDKAMELLRECRPTLVRAKENLGKDNQNYQELCSTVAAVALSKVIASVNNAMTRVNLSYFNKNDEIKSARKVLLDAWKATLMMEVLDLSKHYKEGIFEQNKKTLISIMSNTQTYRDPYINIDFDMRTDDEFYDSCRTIEDIDNYLKNFPSGKHKNEAIEKRTKKVALKKKVKTIALVVLGVLFLSTIGILVFSDSDAEKRSAEKAIQSHNLEYCENYLLRHPNGIYRGGVIRAMSDMEDEFVEKHFSKKYNQEQANSYEVTLIRQYYEIYKLAYPSGRKKREVEYYVDVNSQYADSKKLNYNSTIEDYEAFFSSHNITTTDCYKSVLSDYERKFDWERYKDNHLETGAQPYHAAYGWNDSFGSYDRYSTIVVVAPTNSDVIVIVKRNNESGPVAGHVYIRAGGRASIDVPNGIYKPIFYYGKGWKPTKVKVDGAPGAFVGEESYSTISGTETLYDSEVTYTLQLSTNGNLHTRSISESSAF